VKGEVGADFCSFFLPSRSPSREKNSTDNGAINSCSIQPQLNHRLFRKATSHVVSDDRALVACAEVKMSDRYA
jgi:hypothetical protein